MEKTSQTFFFYDLETSGFDARTHRIMQFAGQRTDLGLNPIGNPINILVALSEDVLPSPEAILITGITPQKTREEGYTEAEFLKILHDQVLTPGTIIAGFNSVRFDDEFMRHTLYRNFYDAYEWQWKDGRGRWDLLDVVRMTRALRPEGINWPVDQDGQPTNRLELLTKANGLDHANAHDALSDVNALISLARLIKQKQPKLFEYLLSLRHKQAVAEVVNLDSPAPFVYASGRYPKSILHTTVAYPLAPGSKPGSVIVYDLRHDPADWQKLSVDELKAIRFANYEKRQMEGFVPLPAKELSYNRCPAVAPLGVLDEPTQERIKLELQIVKTNLTGLRRTDLADKLAAVFDRDSFGKRSQDVDGRLYDGFVNDSDKTKMHQVRQANAEQLADLSLDFADDRMGHLMLRYKARNHPKSLAAHELQEWEKIRHARVKADLPGFAASIQKLSQTADQEKQFLLQELQLWAESIAPLPEEEA